MVGEEPGFDMAGHVELLVLRGVRLEAARELGSELDAAFSADRPTVINAVTDPDIPLLPPFPHGREMLERMRTGLRAEGDTGSDALDLLETYVCMEERYL